MVSCLCINIAKSCSNLENQGYVSMSGTSVAMPMIAGISALLLEKKPNLLPDQVKQILISCCKGITYNKNLEGFGYPCFKA